MASSTPAPEMSESAPRDVSRWRMAHVELDEASLELRVHGAPVALERKPLELLMWLLRHPGEVVTKDELFDALWAGRVVTESVLTKCVAKLRQAIADDGQTLIKTVHGYGYRLVAPVERLAQQGVEPVAPAALAVGDSPPLRPNWRLVHRYDASRGENWLAEHSKTGEKRVFKFAHDAAGVSQLKREITLHRLLRDTLGPRDDIVRVLDWNLEEPPCFVELEHCAQGNLIDWATAQGGAAAVPLATRLELVAQTADALAAAHSAGVLHKDVKPANVLIELDAAGAPRVRLGDFGSARVLDGDRLQALEITRMGFTHTLAAEGGASTSGTWAYLAPEVVAGQPPTARADIYSLGVLLWQMAVGDLRRPLAPGWERDVDDALLREDIAACCDSDPARRLGDAAELARRLRSLAPRRAEAAARRAEAERSAALQSDRDRGRVRQRWLSVVAGVTLAGLIVTGGLFIQVREARNEAERQAAAARGVNDFLVRDLIGAANPMGAFGMTALAPPNSGQVPVRELLDRAAAQAGDRFAGQPALEAAVRRSLGEAYGGLSLMPEAAQQFEAAARIGASLPTPDHLAVARMLLEAGMAWTDVDQIDSAAARLDEALAALPTGEGAAPLRVRIEGLQAYLAYRRGDATAAGRRLVTLESEVVRTFGDPSPELAEHLSLMAEVLREAGEGPRALAAARRANALTVSLYGEDHPRTLRSRGLLAIEVGMAGRWDQAEPEMRRRFELSRKLLGDDHHVTLGAQAELSYTLQQLRRYDEAAALLEDALPRRLRVFGEMQTETAAFMNNLGSLYIDADRPAEALSMLRRAYRITHSLQGSDHPDSLIAQHHIVRAHQRLGQWSEAQALQRELLPRAQRVFGEGHRYRGAMSVAWGRTQHHFGERRAARTSVEQGLTVLVAALGAEHEQVQQARRLLQSLEQTTAP